MGEGAPPFRSVMEDSHSGLFARLAASPFRSRFHLAEAERAYVDRVGWGGIREHAARFIRTRLAAAEPANDGRQTPMRGHPVFVAQHACACCCRDCLAKWHGIPRGAELTEAQQQYILSVLLAWLERAYAAPAPPRPARRKKGAQQALFGFMEQGSPSTAPPPAPNKAEG